jgi:Fur family transcriptional regulator, ferric uptake regulator
MIASTQTNHPLTNSSNAAQTAGEALDLACARLKSAGLRITQPRIAILTAMINRSEPATIEQLHSDLKDSSCDLVTVYRCLAAFEELGLVRRCFFLNGTSLYQIQLGNQPVYHVVSKEGAILDTISDELSAELQAVIAKIEAELKGRGYSEITNMAAFFATAATTSRIPASVTANL